MQMKRSVREVEMDFPRNPVTQLSHAHGFRPLIFDDCRHSAMIRKAFREGASLIFGLQPRNFEACATESFLL
jgi:hypothetical protein